MLTPAFASRVLLSRERRLLARTYKRDSHGRFGSGGGGRVEGQDISATADHADIYSRMAEPEIGSRPRHAPKVGDEALGEIQRLQGFDGPPTVVSREEFDRAVAAGEVTETFRGVHGGGAQDQADAYRDGDLYPGTGIYGNGTYVAMDRSQADAFAGRHPEGDPAAGAVLRIGLASDVRVVSLTGLRAEMSEYMARQSGRTEQVQDLDRQMRRAAERTDTIEDQVAVYNDYNGRKVAAAGPEYLVSQDEGRFAALRGYDAIDVPGGQGGDQMIILNRTAVIVEEG